MAVAGGFFKYLKKAFLVNWNLLALAAGTALGVISGHPDVIFPIMAAGEVVYLAGLSAHPRFQQAIDAEEHKAQKQSQTQAANVKTQQVFEALSNEDRRRFEKLRDLCRELREISQGVKGETAADPGVMGDLQSSSINRLLWIYLKLLYSKNALEQFFATIDQKQIQTEIAQVQERLDGMGPPEKDTPTATKMRKSLVDHLATSQARLDNYQRAKENYDLIQVDLDRLYAKIASLGEMGINRQDPNFISNEMDAVSASVAQTEKAMDDLQFITGLAPSDETPPRLIEMDDQQSTQQTS